MSFNSCVDPEPCASRSLVCLEARIGGAPLCQSAEPSSRASSPFDVTEHGVQWPRGVFRAPAPVSECDDRSTRPIIRLATLPALTILSFRMWISRCLHRNFMRADSGKAWWQSLQAMANRKSGMRIRAHWGRAGGTEQVCKRGSADARAMPKVALVPCPSNTGHSEPSGRSASFFRAGEALAPSPRSSRCERLTGGVAWRGVAWHGSMSA